MKSIINIKGKDNKAIQINKIDKSTQNNIFNVFNVKDNRYNDVNKDKSKLLPCVIRLENEKFEHLKVSIFCDKFFTLISLIIILILFSLTYENYSIIREGEDELLNNLPDQIRLNLFYLIASSFGIVAFLIYIFYILEKLTIDKLDKEIKTYSLIEIKEPKGSKEHEMVEALKEACKELSTQTIKTYKIYYIMKLMGLINEN